LINVSFKYFIKKRIANSNDIYATEGGSLKLREKKTDEEMEN